MNPRFDLLELLAKHLTKNDYDKAVDLIDKIENDAYDTATNNN